MGYHSSLVQCCVADTRSSIALNVLVPMLQRVANLQQPALICQVLYVLGSIVDHICICNALTFLPISPIPLQDASTPRRRQETLETLKKSSGIVNKSFVAADVGPWTETQQWIRVQGTSTTYRMLDSAFCIRAAWGFRITKVPP